MIILGVDPGLDYCGYGLIRWHGVAPSLLEAGVIRPGRPSEPLERRLVTLDSNLSELLEEYRPDALALEQLYSHYGHPITAVLMGHARGVICVAAGRAGVPVHSYSATQIKHCLTGAGRASKEQMQRAIQARLRLKSLPRPSDVADALATALCHGLISQSPLARAATS